MVLKEYNASTGYSWKSFSDNSGVYEITEEIVLYPSTSPEFVGVPGVIIWIFKVTNKSKESERFELYPYGKQEPVETIFINIEVSK